MPENNKSIFTTILFFSCLIFFVSLIFSFRAICSISIGIMLITGLLKNKTEHKTFLSSNLKNPLLFPCCLVILLEFISLFYTSNIADGWRNIRLKSALVLIPLALCSCDYVDEAARQKLLKWYCFILFAACLFAIFQAFQKYSSTGDWSVFVYHSLVSSYSGHAIQYSIIVFIALLHLFEALFKKDRILNSSFHFFLIFFFSLFLFLLSSKLVITFFTLYFFLRMINLFTHKSINKMFIAISVITLIVVSTLIFATRNPVSNRFREIIQTDFSFLKKESFNPGVYLNGLQFRLLQWKFVPGILNEKKAWFAGVSAGDAQDYLNQTYIDKNMYVGTAARGDKGFIGYNTHNQFLEALLQTGIIGCLLFLLVCRALIKMARQRKKAELSFVTILLIIYSLGESVFETQYSLCIFLFFPVFFYLDKTRSQQ